MSGAMMFTIGEPALPEYLIDRTEEVDDLVSLLSNPRIIYNLAVIGYRRIGKTSILNKVEQQLEDKNCIVVRFDVKKKMGSPEVFFDRLNVEIFRSYARHLSRSKRLKKTAGKLGNQIIQTINDVLSKKKLVGLSIETSVSANGTLSVTPKIEFPDQRTKQQRNDYQEIMETVFGAAGAFAEESNTRFIIILDEFQDITRLRRYRGLHNIMDQFRSVVQERGTKVSYVICGSRVHMLRELLEGGGSPLFMHAKEYPIHELKHEHAVQLFESYLIARGIKEEKGGERRTLAEQAYKIVGGHPFYIMSLAEAWKRRETIVETFERELRSPTGSLYVYEDYVLSEDLKEATGGPILRTILQVLASSRAQQGDEATSLTLTGIANRLNKPAPQIEPYLTELVKFDLLIKDEKNKTYAIRDKVLEKYLRIEAEEIDDKKIVLPK